MVARAPHLLCAEGKLYTGLTRREVDARVSEHPQGTSSFARKRRPVDLIFSEHYEIILDAVAELECPFQNLSEA